VVMNRHKFSVKKVMEVLSPQLQRIFGLFFDTTGKYTFRGLLDGICKKFKHALLAIPRLVFKAVKFIVMCVTPPFPILHKIHMDLAKAVQNLSVSVLKLPARIAKALKRIVLLPKDVYRFCGSMKMLIQFMMYMKRDSSKLPMLKQITEKQELDEVDDELDGSKQMQGVKLPGGLSKLEADHADTLSMEDDIDIEDLDGKEAEKPKSTKSTKTADDEAADDTVGLEEAPELARDMELDFEMRMSRSNSIRSSFASSDAPAAMNMRR